MKKFLITALTVANAITVLAAAHSRVKDDGAVMLFNKVDYSLPSAKQLRKAPSSSVYVDFSIADQENFEIRLAVAIDAVSGNLVYAADGATFGGAELPAGSYNFMFWGEGADYPYSFYILSEENVEISESCEYNVDFGKCTALVEFESRLPNGERAIQPLENLDTDEIVEEGNLAFGVWSLYVFLDDLLIDIISGNMDRGVFDDGWEFDTEASGNVYVNEGASALSLVQYRQLIGDADNAGIYYASITSSPARGGVFYNDPADYAFLDNPYFISSAGEEEARHLPVLYTSTLYNGHMIAGSAWVNNLGKWPETSHYWVGKNDDVEKLGMAFYSNPGIAGGMGNVFSNYGDNYMGIVSNPMINIGGKIELLADVNTFNSISTLVSYNSFTRDSNGLVIDFNPWFSFDDSKKRIEDGNSVPVLVTEQCWYPQATAEEYGLRNVLYHSFKGRNGEVKTIDLLGESVKVSINDIEQDLSKYPTLHSFTGTKSNERLGTWDIEIVDNNCYSNGNKGLNTIRIHFNDQGDDVCAPTLQMLQTLDTEGNITDVFDSPEKGRIVIAGGDFYPNYNDENGVEWFGVKECRINVECAVAGSDEWQTLEYTEDPDRFMMPGWGYYWEVSLATLPSYNVDTQYDLRITLTDEAANSQEQILSPVFTTKGTVGITAIMSSSEGAKYYNLQGGLVSQPVAGEIYIERRNDGTSRKVIMK